MASSICQIDCGPSMARLWGDNEAVELAAKILTFENPKARFLKSVQYGKADGKLRLLRRPQNTFPAGLTHRIEKALKNSGYMVTLNDPQKPFETPFCDRLTPDPETQDKTKRRFDKLAPHQVEAVEYALKARRCALQSPTASGKTLIGMEIMRRTGYRTLWMVVGDRLINDTIASIRKRLPGVEVGKVGAGSKEWGTIVVGSVATLKNIGPADPFWQQFQLLIVDECHHLQADTWGQVASRVPAFMRIGLSGTVETRKPDPVRMARIEGMVGPTYEVIDHQELAEIGFIARPRVVFLRPKNEGYLSYTQVRDAVYPRWREDPKKLMTLGTKMHGVSYKQGVVENKHRNLVILQSAQAHALANDKIVVLVRLIQHAKWLAEVLGKHTGGKFPVWALNGTDKPEVRDAVLSEFRDRKGGAVLFATPFFQEGIDIPEIDVFFLGGAGKSDTAVLQALGRSLRPRPDKDEVLIYDVLDGHYPFHNEKDYLFNQFTERLDIYKAKRFCITMPAGFAA